MGYALPSLHYRRKWDHLYRSSRAVRYRHRVQSVGWAAQVPVHPACTNILRHIRLIPKIPLYAGVLLTSLDVFVVLIVFNSYPNESRNKSITAFEILISAMVLTVLSSFLVLLVRLSPDWGDVFEGYLPSSTIIGPGALYISVGYV